MENKEKNKETNTKKPVENKETNTKQLVENKENLENNVKLKEFQQQLEDLKKKNEELDLLKKDYEKKFENIKVERENLQKSQLEASEALKKSKILMDSITNRGQIVKDKDLKYKIDEKTLKYIKENPHLFENIKIN